MNRFAGIAMTGLFTVVASASAQVQKGTAPPPPSQPGQKGSVAPGQSGQQGAYQGGYGQTPWFSNANIRQQFNLNNQQYDQLNKNYADAYGRYQQGINNLDKGLNAQQRMQRMAELRRSFDNEFSKSANNVITDPSQQQRYNQLYMQYQAYNAFMNPTIQDRLKLTPEQSQKLQQYGQVWHNQMNELGNRFQTDQQGATSQYNDMRKQAAERINSVLTPAQQSAWQQMTGQPYQFEPSSYFKTQAGALSNQPSHSPSK